MLSTSQQTDQSTKHRRLLGLLGSIALLTAPLTGWTQMATDLECSKCVDTGDLAPGAVHAGRIADEAIRSRHLRDGLIETTKLRDGAVTKAKIVDLHLKLTHLT